MSLTCQLLPPPVAVTAYGTETVLRPLVSVNCWLTVTTKVRLDAPKARNELIAAVPVATCF